MTIPSSYIGHKDFLDKKIIKEFYPLDTPANADKWVKEDIVDNYGPEFRVSIVRVTAKTVHVVQDACIRKGVGFRNHTSTDRLSPAELNEFFKEPLTQHIVLGVKANLIPNRWKLRIGATHEFYTNIVDNSVQIQGLPGRMTGYWRADIEGGHKTGPYRTSINAIEEYEKTYIDPFGTNSYQTAGFKKKKGKVSAEPTMLSSKHIQHLEAVDLPVNPRDPASIPIVIPVSPEDFNRIDKKGTRWNIELILEIVKTYSKDTYDKIKTMENKQVVQPETDKSYNKLVTAFVRASETNRKYTWTIGEIKQEDTYQVYLDNRSHRIIVSIYYGSKTITPA
jgi:hypothetical protein